MNQNLNQREQVMWVLTETGRQLLAIVKFPVERVSAAVASYRESQAVERELDARLTDHGLIDRIVEDRGTVFNPQPVARPVRPLRSIDGIIRAQLA